MDPIILSVEVGWVVPTGEYLDLRNHVCVRIAVFVGHHFKAL